MCSRDAEVVELADTQVSEACPARGEGSTPSLRIIFNSFPLDNAEGRS